MAAGDVKGDNAIIIKLVAGAAVAKGQLVDMQTDTFFDPSAAGATGKFAVAIEAAAAAADEFRAVVYGEVEVTASAAAISKGTTVIAADTGLVAKVAVPASTWLIAGTTMEAFASGGTGTIFVGLVN